MTELIICGKSLYKPVKNYLFFHFIIASKAICCCCLPIYSSQSIVLQLTQQLVNINQNFNNNQLNFANTENCVCNFLNETSECWMDVSVSKSFSFKFAPIDFFIILQGLTSGGGHPALAFKGQKRSVPHDLHETNGQKAVPWSLL